MDGATEPYMDVFTGVFWKVRPALTRQAEHEKHVLPVQEPGE